MRPSRLLALIALCCLAFLTARVPPTLAAEGAGSPEQIEFFEKKIRPLFVEACYKCHSELAKKLKGGLRVDGRELLLKGGDSGPALVPGQPEKSKLIEAVRYGNVDLRMPPRGKLSDSAIADLTAWVKMGAPWPGNQAATTLTKETFDLHKRRREHWAWQPVRPTPPPAVKDATWPRTPSDRFLLARLEEKGLHPAPEADRRTLLRRVTFDLIGLPPTPEEIDAFLKEADARPQAAYEKVVDRLLASPHFGERWARHWLDLVRYGETRGHEFDPVLPNAYQYRDYVIRAFNADVPYNQLVLEHLAGDLLEKPRLHPTAGCNESILGTGFWLLGEEVHSPVDVCLDQADRFDNRIDVFGKTFLALTVSCTRCHDHKFDAISTRDYYSLFAFLESSNYRLVRFDGWEQNRKVAADLERLQQRCQAQFRPALARRLKPTADRLADYLLAACEALRSRPALLEVRAHGSKEGVRAATFGPLDRQHLDRIAAKRKLQADLLAAWTAETINAGRDPQHFLYPWAHVTADHPEGLKPLVAELKQQQTQAEQALQRLEVVVDYSRSRPEDWLPDDVSFGATPHRAGEIQLNGDRVRLVERSAAEYDRFWDGLAVAPGTQNEPGKLGNRGVRAGRTLRTPTFTIGPGPVHYLVRGNGFAYAAVSNHVMIEGPLHSQLVLPLQAGPGYRWISHNLSAYKGLRTHVEFTAAAGSDFAVALVVQAPATPTVVDRLAPRLLQILSEQASSAEALARGYRQLLNEPLQASDSERAEYARLVNFLLQRPDLLGEPDSGKELESLAQACRKEQQDLLGQVRRESRLALALQDGNGVGGHVFIRGSHKAPGEAVQRRFLEALAGKERLPGPGSGRLELARLTVDPARNPFISRVIVNRIWHHLFGVGLVPSVDNFGFLGEAPSHPELLDFLADRFVREGWSIKKTIRELVLSSAYRMASKEAPAIAEQLDPQDRLLHRMRVRRLEGEAIRDSLLAISGRLDRTLAGPSVPIYLTPFLEGRGRPASGPLDGNGRRSIYLAVTRNFLSPLMLAFDTPIPFSTVGRRTVSNVPAQALILLNDPFVHQQTELWGKKIAARPGTPGERIERTYLEAFGRPCSEAERQACLAFLQQQAQLHKVAADQPAPWIDLAHTLINVKEFIYLH